jgi:hypothetical protein
MSMPVTCAQAHIVLLVNLSILFFFDKYIMISLKSAEGRNPSTQEVYKDNTPLKIKRRTQLYKLLHARYLGDV